MLASALPVWMTQVCDNYDGGKDDDDQGLSTMACAGPSVSMPASELFTERLTSVAFGRDTHTSHARMLQVRVERNANSMSDLVSDNERLSSAPESQSSD
jgi:hypothetical protein